MSEYPFPLKEYPELDYKLGIKSSLNKIASVIALTYILYVVNGRKPHLVYSEEYTENDLVKIRLVPNLLSKIKAYLPNIEDAIISANPLLNAQMEALQVGLQLIYRLTKVSFVDGSSSTKERTGGNRYSKQFDFGTNIKLLDLFLSSYPQEKVSHFLESWLNNVTRLDDNEISQGVKMYLSIFSEDVPAKIRNEREEEIIFKQIGIYEHLTQNDKVVDTDAKENVGPFRVFKSIFKEGVHPYIFVDNGFTVNEDNLESLKDYSQLVNNTLSMLPNREVIYTEVVPDYNMNFELNSEMEPLQIIFYGAPGTGKSYAIDDKTDDANSVRTTFHPDSDYASFVGAYKPTMENVPINSIYGESVQYATGKNGHPGTEKKIVYKYVPQAFLKAYVAAWSDLDNPHFLIIEEINRGNCAQIFGDLFQLLDRNSQGASSYAIHADEDIAQFLAGDEKGFAKLSDEQKEAISSFVLVKDNGKTEAIGGAILSGEKLLLPPNLYIWATMNTSDQSLFPIDSAFKRRWNWRYVPIQYFDVSKDLSLKHRSFEIGGTRYSWAGFLRIMNPIITELTDSADKQMGFFFAKPDKKSNPGLKDNDVISEDIFVNKVLFYLWTDVLKDYNIGREEFKNPDKPGKAYEFADFFEVGKNYLGLFVAKLGVAKIGDKPNNAENGDQPTDEDVSTNQD